MIADDLTGACDAAVPFALHGFGAVVWLTGVIGSLLADGSAAIASEGAPACTADLHVLPTFSRGDDVEQARRKVQEACRQFPEAGARLIYKKIDSTLKGNLAEEIDAVLASGCFRSAIVTPAFPAMGRLIVDGLLQVNGETTALHLPSLLRAIPAARAADASSDQDLRKLAEEALAGGGEILCVGSGGLAAQLAAALAARFAGTPQASAGEKRQTADTAAGRKPGPALFLIGSDQPATLAQLDYLVRNRPARTLKLAEVDRVRAVQAFEQDQHLVVIADVIEANEAAAAWLLSCVPEHLAAGMVLSGGDTAAWACRAGAIEVIEVQGEVLPGIPRGTARSASGQRWSLVTKAGGFGAPQALAQVGDFLSGKS